MVLTALAFFVSFCYLDAFYGSLNIPWGNLSVADILVKGIPALGVVVVTLAYLIAEPGFPWHDDLAQVTLASTAFVRLLLPLTSASALVAIVLGKVRARRYRHSRRRVDIRAGDQVWKAVVVIAFGKDVIACLDPKSQRSFLVPWSILTLLETSKEDQIERGRRARRKD